LEEPVKISIPTSQPATPTYKQKKAEKQNKSQSIARISLSLLSLSLWNCTVFSDEENGLFPPEREPFLVEKGLFLPEKKPFPPEKELLLVEKGLFPTEKGP
jgi:hypothetical protein